MRSLFLLSLFSIVAFAEEVPAYMKDGVITVKLKNGKEYTYSTNEWKVVRRGTSKPKEVLKEAEQAPKVAEAPKPLKNRFRLLGGYGYTGGLKVTKDATSAEITPKKGFVGGVGYDRLLTDKISGGATVLSNDSLLLNLGLDY